MSDLTVEPTRARAEAQVEKHAVRPVVFQGNPNLCICSECQVARALIDALEFIERNGHGHAQDGDDCNYYMRFHEGSRYICTCGYDALLEGDR